MQRLNFIKRNLPPGILAVSLLAIYLATLAPGLSWANAGADGGDLITAAATGGIAHPTGYPLYLLVARLFQWLPIGSLAFRTNLMSALAAVAAAVLVFNLVTRYLSATNIYLRSLAGLASGFAYGLSPLLWSQAVITEVYALHAMLVALLLYFSMDFIPPQFGEKRADLLLGLIFGLAMGNHVTTIFLFPVLFSGVIIHKSTKNMRNRWFGNLELDGRSLLRRLIWAGVGLLVYLTLPLRALSHPPVNWGNPVTLNGFLWLVMGKLYQGQLFSLALPSVLDQGKVVIALFLDQFGILGLTIGLIGLMVFFKPTRLYFLTLWIVFASSVFAIIYATADAFMYLIPAFLCFAIWIGMGLAGLMDALSHRSRIIGIAIAIILILVLFIQAGNHWQQIDASHDQRAEAFGENVMSVSPTNAIVFAKGDRAVFSMWYYEFALHKRPDLSIVVTDLLQFDWYQQTLHATYPDLNVPGPFPFAETVVEANSARPVCYVQYIQLEEISCFPAIDSTQP